MMQEVGDLVNVLTHTHYDSREWRVRSIFPDHAIIGTYDADNNLTSEFVPHDALEVVVE